MSAEILVESAAGVSTVTINRPHKKNALTSAMYEAMTAALDEAETSADIAAVVLRGAGGVFTAGNDIANFLEAANADESGAMAAFAFIRRLAGFDKPLIAAVEGLAIGIGATLCLHCDFVYAAPGTQFAMPFVKLGIPPEGAATLLIPQRFGARAGEMLLLGEPFTAEAAAKIGFITDVVLSERLYAHAADRAGTLARQPRQALLAARRLMRGDRDAILARIDEEARQIRLAVRSPEAKAAFSAFMARSKA